MPESRDCENFICNVQFSVSSDRITCKMKSKIEIETNDIKITYKKHIYGGLWNMGWLRNTDKWMGVKVDICVRLPFTCTCIWVHKHTERDLNRFTRLLMCFLVYWVLDQKPKINNVHFTCCFVHLFRITSVFIHRPMPSQCTRCLFWPIEPNHSHTLYTDSLHTFSHPQRRYKF